MKGFLGNLDELYERSDPTLAAWEAFLYFLQSRMPVAGFKLEDVVEMLLHDPALRAILPEDLGGLEPVSSFQRPLGKALLKRVNRRYGTVRSTWFALGLIKVLLSGP